MLEQKQALLLPGVNLKMLCPDYWRAKFADFYLEPDWIGITQPLPGKFSERTFNDLDKWGNLFNQDGSLLIWDKKISHSVWWDQPQHGLLTQSGDLKLIPREAPLFSDKGENTFDRNQLSGLDPGDRAILFGLSADEKWFAAACDAGFGWIKREIVGIGSAAEVGNFENQQTRMMLVEPVSRILTGAETICAGMGKSFPVNDCYRRTIIVPERDVKGRLGFKTGIIIDDPALDCLPKTAYHLIGQAFKYLGHPYAWGDRDFEGPGRDCSRLVMDVLRTMGFKPPRNSREQLAAGKRRFSLAGMNIKQRLTYLKQTPPGSLLFTPGHVMFFLGVEKGEAYGIHGLFSYRRTVAHQEEQVKVKKVVVSGLSLAGETRAGSLLEQLTDIVMV